jgi:hypothetical protein
MTNLVRALVVLAFCLVGCGAQVDEELELGTSEQAVTMWIGYGVQITSNFTRPPCNPSAQMACGVPEDFQIYYNRDGMPEPWRTAAGEAQAFFAAPAEPSSFEVFDLNAPPASQDILWLLPTTGSTAGAQVADIDFNLVAPIQCRYAAVPVPILPENEPASFWRCDQYVVAINVARLNAWFAFNGKTTLAQQLPYMKQIWGHIFASAAGLPDSNAVSGSLTQSSLRAGLSATSTLKTVEKGMLAGYNPFGPGLILQ